MANISSLPAVPLTVAWTRYNNITIKKIPQMLLSRCEFGKTDYNLNIVHPPVYDDEWDEEDCDD